MAQTRDIKRRIKSVASTQKITKAMELVAATKMRKAVKAVQETRAYAHAAWEIIQELSARTDASRHPLLRTPAKVKKVGLLLIASNRGLCGSFNREIVDAVAAYMREHKQEVVDIEAEIFLLGKRGRDIMYKHGHDIVAEFTKLDMTTRIAEVLPLARAIIEDYRSGKYDKIALAYTDYISAISQKPRVRQLLPIERKESVTGDGEAPGVLSEYLFEPSPEAVLNQMLERLIELQIYQALLESNASEHSARMLAMRNASDNAHSFIDDLTFSFNQARQSAITAEIAEISAGSAALL